MKSRGASFSPVGWTAAAFVLIVTAVTLAAPLLTQHEPRGRVGPAFSPPSTEHFFGTDDIGADIWTLLLYGGRVSLRIGFAAALAGVTVALSCALLSAFGPRYVDTALLRVTELFIALPALPTMIVLAAFFGARLSTLIVALVLFSWMLPARILRSRMLSLREQGYVTAARSFGAAMPYLLIRHIGPDIFPHLMLSFVRLFSRAVVLEASLSFLGLGDPLQRSWGSLLHFSMNYPAIVYTDFWKWWVLAPLLTLLSFVLSLSIVNRELEPLVVDVAREKG